jgi:sugar/nucleoside kinase (ribokinase family)
LLMREQDVDPLAALTALAETAVLKRGAAGCLARHGGREFAVPAVAAREVDATGAGDAFAAGVIAALARGRDLSAALQAGVAEGAQCVGLLGGRPPLRERGNGPGLTSGTGQGEASRAAER